MNYSNLPLEFHKDRPNTGIGNNRLRSKVVLSCGEDTGELLAAMELAGFKSPPDCHDYRCYRFWTYPQFTLVWTGIGTGCLEPLLYEILTDSPVEQICLVGTAGMSRTREGLTKGQCYFITDARIFAAGIHPINDELILHPNWSEGAGTTTGATILSTDYYYGLSRASNPTLSKLRSRDRALMSDYMEVLDRIDLVDMETAQFFFLCDVLGNVGLQWAAFKGPANSLSNFNEQSENGPTVLMNSVKNAISLLNIRDSKCE